MMHAGVVPPAGAQQATSKPAPQADTADTADTQDQAGFTIEQIDALLAPIALYPDQLLTQVLIASTFPVQVVAAARWFKEPGHADLKGEALTKALASLDWDPSVKSLIPFPQALSQLDGNLEWTQQLGYAFANQQKEVLDSVQRLRRQAQAEGHLKSTAEQVVRTEAAPAGAVATGSAAPSTSTIVIQPANPNVVYVPSYNPATVYGTWPYPAYPPAVAAPAPAYVPGTALMSGLAFGAGVAITAGLWGWAGANWNSGDVSINANRWNNINVNRARTDSNTWSPSLNRQGGRLSADLSRPPAGPVGRPGRNTGVPANAIGRASVAVPSSLVDRPRASSGAGNLQNRADLSPGSRPGGGQAGQGQRPGGGQRLGGGQRTGAGQGRRPDGGQRPAGGQRLGAGQAQRSGGPGQRAGGSLPSQRSGNIGGQRSGAFGGLGEGNRAAAFGQRGMQSRQFAGGQQFGGRGGGFQGGGMARGGGGFQRAGGGGVQRGGGGFRGGGGGRGGRR